MNHGLWENWQEHLEELSEEHKQLLWDGVESDVVLGMTMPIGLYMSLSERYEGEEILRKEKG
jgi:hypothetical protein